MEILLSFANFNNTNLNRIEITFSNNTFSNISCRYHEIETENVGGFQPLRKKKVPTSTIAEQRPTIGYR